MARNEDLDLTGGEIDVQQLADDLRAARARVTELTQTHRHHVELFGQIAQAAGVHDLGNLDDLTAAVVKQLHIAALTGAAPTDQPPEASAPEAIVIDSGLTCDSCGGPGGADIGDGITLCNDCSGANVMTAAAELLK